MNASKNIRPDLLKFEGEHAPVNDVVGLLRAAGGRPFFMGGCVRDALLGAARDGVRPYPYFA